MISSPESKLVKGSVSAFFDMEHHLTHIKRAFLDDYARLYGTENSPLSSEMEDAITSGDLWNMTPESKLAKGLRIDDLPIRDDVDTIALRLHENYGARVNRGAKVLGSRTGNTRNGHPLYVDHTKSFA